MCASVCQISGTVWLSSLFSASFFFIFGSLCASAFVGAAESSNALASLMLGTSGGHLPLFAATFVCLFHVAALLPNIVLSQIGSRCGGRGEGRSRNTHRLADADTEIGAEQN